MFSDPIMRVGGEKFSYPVPTYGALRGMAESIFWKPTITWVIDKVRILKPFERETKGMRLRHFNTVGADLAYFTYLKNVAYQVEAHFIWNSNRPDFKQDRNIQKYYEIVNRKLGRGGNRDVYLGTRDCQAFAKPCIFGEGDGAYDNTPEIDFGVMYHSMTYPDQAYSEETKDMLTVNFWNPVMKNGVIEFLPPEKCPTKKKARVMHMKHFPQVGEHAVAAADKAEDT